MYDGFVGYVVSRQSDSIVVGVATSQPEGKFQGFLHKIYVARPSQFEPGKEVTISTYLQKTEYKDALYGFESAGQQELFLDLIQCDAIGPRAAINICALGSVDNIKQAIRMGNDDFLQGARGVSKGAKNIILKLARKYSEQHAKVQPDLL